MDIPDDLQPGPAPVAVVRRRGETYDQLDLRKQGYGDEATGYDSSGSTRRGGASPLERSYRLSVAAEREKRMAEQATNRDVLAERGLALREKEFAAQERIHAAAQNDKAAALDQMGYLLDEQDQLAQQYGRGSREYMLGALSIAKKYPVAVMADPRLGQQLNHYDTVLTNAGVPENVKQAVSEIGQADASAENMLGYLDTIPGKYPEIVTDPHVMKLFDTKRKEAAAAQLQREAKAAGLQPDRALVEGSGGNLTMANPKGDASEIKSLERERSIHQGAFDKASARRIQAEKNGSQDLKDAADADIIEAKAKLSDVESQIRTHRETKSDAQPTAAPIKADLRDVKQEMKNLGYFYGETNGEMDEETAKALRRYQIRNGLKQDGTANQETLAAMGFGKGDSKSEGPSTSKAPSPNQAALDWLAANPNDPRAAAVRAKLGK